MQGARLTLQTPVLDRVFETLARRKLLTFVNMADEVLCKSVEGVIRFVVTPYVSYMFRGWMLESQIPKAMPVFDFVCADDVDLSRENIQGDTKFAWL